MCGVVVVVVCAFQGRYWFDVVVGGWFGVVVAGGLDVVVGGFYVGSWWVGCGSCW